MHVVLQLGTTFGINSITIFKETGYLHTKNIVNIPQINHKVGHFFKSILGFSHTKGRSRERLKQVNNKETNSNDYETTDFSFDNVTKR